MIALFIRYFRIALYCAAVCAGSLVFVVTGKTPQSAYRAMVKLFCETGGTSNDFISWVIGRIRRPYALPERAGVLSPKGDAVDAQRAAIALKDSGYYVFPTLLGADVCDRLLRYAQSIPSEICPMDGELVPSRTRQIYERGNPKAVRYDFDPSDLLRNEDIQRLLSDQSLISVAQRYLGAQPVIDVLSMWWLTDFSSVPDSQAAQFYHFDMDRPKWLKFFIYLTDVHPTTGPHSFVPGSHKTGGIPKHLLSKGYARLTDREVDDAYNNRSIEIIAPRGSILAEDTRGLHKGKQIIKGDRLMLQIQFSNSLFGCTYPRIEINRSNASPTLQDAIRRYPRMYSAYFPKSAA